MAVSTSVRRRCEPDCTCGRHSPETRAKVAAASRGRTHSAEAKAKISAAQLGNTSGTLRVRRFGLGGGRKRVPDARVTYTAIHKRLRKERGTPSRCEHCGTTTAKKFEWAFAGPGHDERQFALSADLGQYARLCTSCHIVFDKGRR